MQDGRFSVELVSGIDRVIPNFTSLDDALAHTSPSGSNGSRRPDDGPEGSAAETTGKASGCER